MPHDNQNHQNFEPIHQNFEPIRQNFEPNHQNLEQKNLNFEPKHQNFEQKCHKFAKIIEFRKNINFFRQKNGTISAILVAAAFNLKNMMKKMVNF